jgi:hypothetical protein
MVHDDDDGDDARTVDVCLCSVVVLDVAVVVLWIQFHVQLPLLLLFPF